MFHSYIPDKVISLAKEIWKNLYQVRISVVYNTPLFELQNQGLMLNDDEKTIASTTITRPMTINEMVEKYNAGIPFSIINQKDCVAIYAICNNYMHAYRDYLSCELSAHRPPVEDFVKIDALCEAIFDFSYELYQPQYDYGGIGNVLDGFMLVKAAETKREVVKSKHMGCLSELENILSGPVDIWR